MIVGIGNDIIEIERIRKAASRDRFLEKYFTENENELFESRKHQPQTIGGNFAVKEAVSKSHGHGYQGFFL